ncbi:Sec-independent protein translocase subunit TatA [Streptomyces sp. NPDC004533]|uniref:Sec-independent protein translocase subunit TatA n=1 Tax=unclassified Streptomyces TaxID=2593676 RepID=UPI0033A832E2
MLENRFLEILIIAAVVLLLFGAKRLPETARGLGKSLRIFKSEVSAMKTDTAQPSPAESRVIQAASAEPAAPTAAPTEPAPRVV